MITITVPRRGAPRYRVRDEQEVPTAAHVIFYSRPNQVLMLRRVGSDYGGHWGLPGGGIEPGETPLLALIRECVEEIGVNLRTTPKAIPAMVDLGVFANSQTYALGWVNAFAPVLNAEHGVYQWVDWHNLPQPIHPNALRVLQYFRGRNHE